MKKKKALDIKDVRCIYGFMVLTWVLFLCDAIIIHGLARDRSSNLTKHAIEKLEEIKRGQESIVEFINNLSLNIENHKEKIHYGK